MRVVRRRVALATILVTFTGAIWLASDCWERRWATPVGEPTISQNGCYRLERFQPFWVLPAVFHRRVQPDALDEPEWFPWWGLPGFYRLYDHRDGKLIAETDVFDLNAASGPIRWGDGVQPYVASGLISIGPNVPDCIGGER